MALGAKVRRSLLRPICHQHTGGRHARFRGVPDSLKSGDVCLIHLEKVEFQRLRSVLIYRTRRTQFASGTSRLSPRRRSAAQMQAEAR